MKEKCIDRKGNYLRCGNYVPYKVFDMILGTMDVSNGCNKCKSTFRTHFDRAFHPFPVKFAHTTVYALLLFIMGLKCVGVRTLKNGKG